MALASRLGALNLVHLVHQDLHKMVHLVRQYSLRSGGDRIKHSTHNLPVVFRVKRADVPPHFGLLKPALNTVQGFITTPYLPGQTDVVNHVSFLYVLQNACTYNRRYRCCTTRVHLIHLISGAGRRGSCQTPPRKSVGGSDMVF